MNKSDTVALLCCIAQETQYSFVNPVILFTLKDYATNIFDSLVDIRQALHENAAPYKVLDIVRTFHINWLEAVQDVEKFKKRIKETPRDFILQAIQFTMDCTEDRFTRLQKYIQTMQSTMSDGEYKLLQADLEVIKETQNMLHRTLIDKEQYIRSQADQTEYYANIYDEVEELMNWVDKINNSLALQLCKVIHFKEPLYPSDLTKNLKQIIDEIASNPTPKAQRISELINNKETTNLSSPANEFEITTVVNKIKTLENRMNRLQTQNSSAVLALRHKKIFLEERLQSLENLKMSMKLLQKDAVDNDNEGDKADSIYERKDSRIFSHLLPHNDRCHLVEHLMQLWNNAIGEQDQKSIISILSVTDFKEIFCDDHGNFTMDKYGRKIYSKENDDTLYQLNELDELVPLKDDEKHIYLYDSCGRYYINETKQRIYKDHDGASEYIFDKCGYLLKVQEEINGIQYYFDWLGRYYINQFGSHIYCEENSSVQYEHDGIGNLVKIHTEPFYDLPCQYEPMTMEENKYLEQAVGQALKKCIAEVVINQPKDPVANLADRLYKYSEDVKERQKRLKDEQERFEHSQCLRITRKTSESLLHAVNEGDVDYNFINYGKP